ncbi:MAG: aldehyde dehydrogenase family protein [Polyangiaceae bacterium]
MTLEPLSIVEKATGNVLAELPCTTREALERAVSGARTSRWSTCSVETRLERLGALRRALAANAQELADLLSQENGKPRHEALLHEVVPLLDFLDWLTPATLDVSRAVNLPSRWLPHRAFSVTRRPHRACAVLSPFNFPLLISGNDALSALAMGSSVLLKPSEHCPLSTHRLVRLAHEAGIPEDALTLVIGGREVGEWLVKSEVDAVVFTGASSNGRAVAVECAERLRPCTLELGGNCPLLVLADADVPRTAKAICYGAMANSGQSCLAVGRVYVPRALESVLVDALRHELTALRQGDPMQGPVELGSLTTRAQLDRCDRHVDHARARGARIVLGGERRASIGNFYAPTLLQGCVIDDWVVQEETFGPVLPLVPYDDERAMIEQLNQDRAGLAAYVFGGDVERARAVAEGLDYAHVVVDHVLLTYVCPDVPLAGLRDSGQGVVHGTEGLLARTSPKVLATPRARLPAPVEFGLLDPERAMSVAQTLLRTTNIFGKVRRFFRT